MPSFFGARPVAPAAAVPLVSEDVPLAGAEPGAVLHINRAAAGRQPAFVIALGLHPADPGDPRVRALLDGLGARGFAVGLVESPALDADRLQPDAPNDLVAAFDVMAKQPSVDSHRIGLLGFSVGGSLALLAAADPRIAPRVRLVEALGAYASLEDVARATLTGSYRTRAGSVPWSPDQLTRMAVPQNLIELLAPPADQAPLLNWQAVHDRATAPPEGLSPEGDQILELLRSGDEVSFDAALASLPASAAAVLRKLSPAASGARVQAPVYLMVDRHDPLIPAVESVNLAQALTAERHPVYFSSFDLFRHVEPTHLNASPGVLRDILRLFWHAQAVLERLQS